MLAATALLAAFCAWFAAARKQADLQDQFITDIKGEIWWKRWGPEWFDFFGADRFRRRIVGASLHSYRALEDARVEGFLQRLAQSSRLQYLFLDVELLTPQMVDALSGMPQLRILSIEAGAGFSDDCLAVIGRMTELEVLQLGSKPGMGGWTATPLATESLACLKGLRKLRALHLERTSAAVHEVDRGPRMLKHLPTLPQLEVLNIGYSDVCDDDLPCLAVVPHLRSLSLLVTDVTRTGLAQLAPLESLEELAIDADAVSAAGFESLLACRHLKKLHIGESYRFDPYAELPLDGGTTVQVSKGEFDGCLKALGTLRRSKPGIVVDGNLGALAWAGRGLVPSEYGDGFDPWRIWVPAAGIRWLTPAEKAAADAWVAKIGPPFP